MRLDKQCSAIVLPSQRRILYLNICQSVCVVLESRYQSWLLFLFQKLFLHLALIYVRSVAKTWRHCFVYIVEIDQDFNYALSSFLVFETKLHHVSGLVGARKVGFPLRRFSWLMAHEPSTALSHTEVHKFCFSNDIHCHMQCLSNLLCCSSEGPASHLTDPNT